MVLRVSLKARIMRSRNMIKMFFKTKDLFGKLLSWIIISMVLVCTTIYLYPVNKHHTHDIKKTDVYYSRPAIHYMENGIPRCNGRNIDLNCKNQKNPNCAFYPNEIFRKRYSPIIDSELFKSEHMVETEKLLFNDTEFVNPLDLPDLQYSEIRLLNPKKQYKVGDQVVLMFDLKYFGGGHRLQGGDDVRVSVSSDKLGKYSAANIQDFNNGSYLISFTALWSGDIEVRPFLIYAREVVASMFRWRRTHRSLFIYYGEFTKPNTTITELTLCSAFPVVPGYPLSCDLTEFNHGVPFYCGKPSYTGLTCSDIQHCHEMDNVNVGWTSAEYLYFFGSYSDKVKSTVKMKISKGNLPNITMSCNKLPRRETWNYTMSSGYWHNKHWYNLRCKNNINKTQDMIQCMKNTTFIFVGDSTIRQWYIKLRSITNCTHISAPWIEEFKSYIVSECEENRLGFRVIWYPHNLPFFDGFKEPKTNKINIRSVHWALDSIPKHGRYVLVFHYFAHYSRFHYKIFEQLISSAKPHIRAALKRNKDLIIAVKGPHTFRGTTCLSTLNDFLGPTYMNILKKELAEFKDQVVFLNYWEMYAAINHVILHPYEHQVWDNIRYLLGYIC